MKKSREFILKGGYYFIYMNYLNGQEARGFCREPFERAFGIKVREGEKKRVKVTIEETK